MSESIYKSLKQDVIDSSEDFHDYLYEDILGADNYEIFSEILGDGRGYLLSGIIRDYFLKRKKDIRDLDFVFKLNKLNPKKYQKILREKSISYRYNSFKGLKIKSSELPDIDAWLLENTWGIKHQKIKPTINSLIDSVFFNFSAIVFDLHEKKFIFNDHFIDFLSTRTIDIVYPENPNIPLCLFNICYYATTLDLGISDNIKKWINTKYIHELDFEPIQLKHLGYKKYSSKFINNYLKKITK